MTEQEIQDVRSVLSFLKFRAEQGSVGVLYSEITAIGKAIEIINRYLSGELVEKEELLRAEDVANIIHKGIYEKDMSEDFPVRNLHIYAIAKMICNKKEGI